MDNLVNFIYEYDGRIIAIFLVINIVLFVWVNFLLKQGKSILHPLANIRFGIAADMTINKKDIEKLQRKKRSIIMLYSFYANITAIFPLLGIAGTVAALITFSGETNMMDNLMVALNTTLWGVICAIFSKVFDSVLSSKIEEFLDDADHVIWDYDEKGEVMDEV